VSTLIGILIRFLGLDPIKALFWSAVINNVVAVPLMVILIDGGRGEDHVCDLVRGLGEAAELCNGDIGRRRTNRRSMVTSASARSAARPFQ
jgi:hypothetical protein